MREAEENIKFKMEIDVLVPIPRTVTRDFTSLKHLRQWQKRNDIDGSLYFTVLHTGNTCSTKRENGNNLPLSANR
ncbi:MULTISPECIES: hypothetical protein [Bacteroidales]|uniref:hypothetical protein n=1 Tax=Bacteroidales TaxID=171549 RepID=UPI001E3FD0F3|nr:MULTISPECIES: hypothetical protein [Bacteroidales]MDB9081689.1 hypothetical protein [Parabacteroides distasonis]